MAANSSQFVRSWLGTAVGGLVEVPINTAYEGEFLRHQAATVQPAGRSSTMCLPSASSRSTSIRTSDRALLGYRHRLGGARPSTLLRAQWLGGLRRGTTCSRGRPPEHCPIPAATSLASIFFTSGTTGPSKGVAMPHSQMYFFGQEVVSLTRLTEDDTYMTVHAACSTATRSSWPPTRRFSPARAVVVRPEVQREPVGRPPAREPRDGDQPDRRDDGLHLEGAAPRRTTPTTPCGASTQRRPPRRC